MKLKTENTALHIKFGDIDIFTKDYKETDYDYYIQLGLEDLFEVEVKEQKVKEKK